MKIIHRLKLVFKKQITFTLWKKFTLMDIGRWLFKISKGCYRCGSPNIIGYKNGGAYCPICEYGLIKFKEQSNE
jgi:hypothetical protein